MYIYILEIFKIFKTHSIPCYPSFHQIQFKLIPHSFTLLDTRTKILLKKEYQTAYNVAEASVSVNRNGIGGGW